MSTARRRLSVLALGTALAAGTGTASAQSSFAPPVATQRQQGFVPAQPQVSPRAQPAAAAPAQRSQGPANALQGFSQNRDKPVKIEAGSLEVRDKDRVATFSGNVQVTQGDTMLRAGSLVVHYEDEPGRSMMAVATAGPNGQQRIRLLEAKGGVRVTQKDQTASGDSGVFNMRENTVTLVGNVVVSRGQDVLRGERLVVDLTNGVSRIEAGKSGSGRVEGMFRAGEGSPTFPGTTLGQTPKQRAN